MTIKKKLALAAALIAVATLAALIFATPPEIPEEPLPSPNGYDDFVRGAPIASENSGNWNEMPLEELRRLIATNHAALEVLRAGLMKDSYMPPYVLNATNSSHLDDLSNQKCAAQAFCAASRLALIDGRTNDAALWALDCIRFGQESTRGGVVIDGLVSFAIQALGRARLEESLPGLDTQTSRTVITKLDAILQKSESPDTVFKREAQWARLGRLGPTGIFPPILQLLQNRKDRARFEQKFLKAATGLQRIQLRAAARAYQLEHGQPPAAARDLVPQYLKSLPLDPTTGQELPLN